MASVEGKASAAASAAAVMMMRHYGMGSLTPAQIAASNEVLTRLGRRLASQSAIIARARTAGFDRNVVAQAEAEYARLLSRLEELSNQNVFSQAFEEWQLRLDSLGSEIDLFAQRVREQFARDMSMRTWRIAGATIGAIAVAALIGGVIWYASQPGRVLAAKRWRKRR